MAADQSLKGATILRMTTRLRAAALLVLSATGGAQELPAQSPLSSVTVPAAIDHNRVVIDADKSRLLGIGLTDLGHAYPSCC